MNPGLLRISRNRRWLVKSALLALTLAFTVVSQAETVFPGAHWAKGDPIELGVNSSALDSLASEIQGQGVVIKDGYLVKSWGAIDRRGDIYSAGNAVFATLLFFAVEEGRVGTVEDPVQKFLWDLDPKDKSMRLSHLLNMTSGYTRPELPGAAWAYRNLGMQLFQMTLFDRIFQAPAVAAALHRDRLAKLEFEDAPVFRDRTNTLIASTRDFARLAWLWCQQGRWGQTQLLPREYFERYLHPQVESGVPLSFDTEDNDYLGIGNYRDESDYFGEYGPGIYGYGWWFNATGPLHPDDRTWPDLPEDTFMAIGIRGSVAAVVPSLNLMLVTTYADWGEFRPGDQDSLYNQWMARLVGAVAE